MINQNELLEAQCFFKQFASKHHKPKHLNFTSFSQEQKEFYKKITFFYNSIPKEIKNISTNILSQLQKLLIKLIPLYQIGFRYDVYLVGGSLRDLLYGNHDKIKDLDVVFYIDSKSIFTVFEENTSLNHKAILGNDLYNHIDPQNDSVADKVHKFFRFCLDKNYEIIKDVTAKNLLERKIISEYVAQLNSALYSVIKVKNENDDYQIDVLLIKSSIEQYIKTFDFEICKVYLPFFDSKISSFITDPVDFFKLIRVTPGFLDDGMNKTITMNMFLQNEIANIEMAIKKHLPRIIDKYNDYKLVLNPGEIEEFIDWKNKYENYTQLNKTLPKKDCFNDKQKKLKI